MRKRALTSRAALRVRFLSTCTAVAAFVVTLSVAGIQANNPGAKIIVRVQTEPKGDAASFTFVLTRPNGRSFEFGLADGDHRTTGQLDSGVYSVTEAATPGSAAAAKPRRRRWPTC